MPNGPAIPQRPFSPIVPAAASPLARRLPPELEELQNRVSSSVLEIASRLKLVEQRIENLRGHLELVDGSLIEKHKSVISELRDTQDGTRNLRADIDSLKEFTERIAKRMEDLASREEVKVLERYVELWQPLQFVTRAEVKTIVQSILKEQGIKIKEQGGN